MLRGRGVVVLVVGEEKRSLVGTGFDDGIGTEADDGVGAEFSVG